MICCRLKGAPSLMVRTKPKGEASAGVGQEDGLCAFTNRRFQLLNVDVVTSEFDVHKHGNQPVLNDRGDGGWKCSGHCQNF